MFISVKFVFFLSLSLPLSGFNFNLTGFIGMTIKSQYFLSHYTFTNKGTIIIVRIIKVWEKKLTINI